MVDCPVFARLLALPAVLFICLLTLLPWVNANAAGLPSLLANAEKAQPAPSEPLAQSLDEVIKNLENDQQRAKLLSDLKKLRDSTRKAQPAAEEGVLGLIGSTLAGFEKQFSGDDSPLSRWSEEFDQAKGELLDLTLPASEWVPMVFAFALILALWSFLAWAMIWLGRQVRLRFGLS